MATYRGTWGDAARDGRLFHATAAASGIVLPIYSNTAQVFGMWNPANSGRNAHIVHLSMGYVDTTLAAADIVWGLLTNVGNSVATAAPISAFTEVVPYRAMSSSTGGNLVRVATGAATVTTALMVLGPVMWSQDAMTAAATVAMAARTYRVFRGELMLAPNTAIFLAGNIAQLGKWIPSITWVEDTI